MFELLAYDIVADVQAIMQAPPGFIINKSGTNNNRIFIGFIAFVNNAKLLQNIWAMDDVEIQFRWINLPSFFFVFFFFIENALLTTFKHFWKFTSDNTSVTSVFELSLPMQSNVLIPFRINLNANLNRFRSPLNDLNTKHRNSIPFNFSYTTMQND